MYNKILQPLKQLFKSEENPEIYIESVKSKFNLNNLTPPVDNKNNAKQVSVWFAMGFASGYTLRKASKVGVVLVGTSFIGLQFLTYYNYISINHPKIESDFISVFDLNKDGKVDNADLLLHYENLKKILSFNLPAGCGYTTGLVLGLKNG